MLHSQNIEINKKHKQQNFLIVQSKNRNEIKFKYY